MNNNDSNILSKRIQKKIEEQGEIEKTLKEQYSILHSIINNTDAIIFSLDKQYRYTSFNNEHASVMKAIYGMEIKIGGNLFDYMTVVEDREKAKHNLDRALAGESLTEEAFSGEELLSRHYFKVSHSPILTEDASIIGVTVLVQDITKQKQAEEAIYQSQEMFRTLVENSPDIIARYDPNCHRTYVNPMYLKMTQIPQDKLLSSTPIQCSPLPPFCAKTLQNLLCKVLDKGIAEAVDVVWPKADNIDYWHNIYAFPEFDREGRVKSVMTISRDITERKRAEETVKKSEERLQQLLSSVTDYIYKVMIEDGIVTETQHGDGCKSITGYTDKEFDKDKFLWINIVHDDDKELVKNQIDKLLVKHESIPIEHRIRHKNGTVRWIRNTPVLHFTHEGVLLGYDGLISNITDRKLAEIALRESEERYRFITILSGHIVYERVISDSAFIWGGAIKKVTGYRPEEYANVNFEKWLEFIHPDDREKTLTLFDESLKQIKPFSAEYRYLNKNNEYIWIEDTSFILSDKYKRTKVTGVMKDITQRKTLERHILNSVIDTEERERIHFSQELHDGIGPLLSAIKMHIQWLTLPNANASQSEIITDIEKLLEESSRSIREISFKLNPHILHNYGIVEAITAYTEKVKESSQIIIELNAENLYRFDEKAETITYRLICECINNTLKHAKASKISIGMKCCDDILFIEYTDDGRGFDVDKVLSGHKGIGLLNMQSRLKSINGFMSISSEPNKGTMLKFHFKIYNN